MYRFLIKPILFLLPPETIHRILVTFLRLFFRIPGVYWLFRSFYHVESKLLETGFLGMSFSNPVGLAAGFDKNAEVYGEFHAFGFSFIEIGTVTPLGQSGNVRPRSFRIPKDRGLINRMGFNNHGAEAAARKLSRRRPKGLILGGNLGKNTQTPNEAAVDDYEAVFRTIYEGVDYFVVNVSCPNITDLHKLQDQESLESILGRILEVRKEMVISKPVLLKISPDLNEKQLDETLDIVLKLQLDGIVATNTTITRDGLKTSQKKIEAIGKGGMSGGPITARSLEIVRYINEKTDGKLPIIAVGGIMDVQDALNMFEAGATLIQLYTGFIYEGPGLVRRINRELLKKRRVERQKAN
ncbi:MAG: quinone-dependent dihydroorotate dehydrogenase [Bacteroidales bacterium]|nr:quinone-dependent dihydroorotate dehydrogenase [Bacteroidales bacterium]